jgi:hypothetical protein
VLQTLTGVDLGAIKYYWFTDGEVAGTPARPYSEKSSPAMTGSPSETFAAPRPGGVPQIPDPSQE